MACTGPCALCSLLLLLGSPWPTLLTPTYVRSPCTLPCHRILHLASLLLPPGFPTNGIFTVLLSSTLARFPTHTSLFLSSPRTRSGFFCRSLSSVLAVYFRLSFLLTGPKILLTSFLSHVTNIFISYYQHARCLLCTSLQHFQLSNMTRSWCCKILLFIVGWEIHHLHGISPTLAKWNVLHYIPTLSFNTIFYGSAIPWISHL